MADNHSFLPEDYLDKKIARRTNVIFVSLFAVVLTAVVAADFVQRRQDAQQIEKLAEHNAQFESMQRQFEQIEELKAKEAEIKNKANVTATLKDTVLKSLVFSELINVMPATLRLTDLDLQTKAAQNDRPTARTSVQREKLRQKATGAPRGADRPHRRGHAADRPGADRRGNLRIHRSPQRPPDVQPREPGLRRRNQRPRNHHA